MTDERMGKETISQEENDGYKMPGEIRDHMDENIEKKDEELSREDLERRDEEEEENSPEKGKGSFLKELLVYAVIIVLCITVVPRYDAPNAPSFRGCDRRGR